eukprot:767111-Hanusia_phi.AAC.3
MPAIDKLVRERLDKLNRKKFSQKEFEDACRSGRLLIVIDDKIFDVESFRHKHPGGLSALERYYSKDASEVFFRVHGPNAHRSLEDLYIGDLEPSIQISCNVNAKLADVESKISHQSANDDHPQGQDPPPKCPFSALVGMGNHQADEALLHQIPGHEKIATFHQYKESKCPSQHEQQTSNYQQVAHSLAQDRSKIPENEDGEATEVIHASEKVDLGYRTKEVLDDADMTLFDRNKHEPHFSTLEALVEENENESNADNKTDTDTPTSSSDGFTESAKPTEKAEDQFDSFFARVKSTGSFSRSSSSGSISRKIVESVLRRTGSGSSLRAAQSDHQKNSYSDASEGGCPFKALTSLQAEFADNRARRRSSITKQDFSSRRGSNVFPGGNDFFSGPGKALESPRSIRSRDNVSVAASRQISVYAQSKRSGHGTNLRSSGGVFRGTRTRRKTTNHKKSSAPPIDRSEWDFHAARLESSWNKLLKKVSYGDLGGAIYESVRDNDILEPLFRFTNRSAQGTKFVDMLSSIIENLNSPSNVYQKIADLAPLHHRKGVEIAHMPMMQEIVMGVFEYSLKDEFSEEEKQSWLWMWEYLTKALDLSLKVICSTMGIVRDSWETILESYTPGQLGEMIYDCLFKLAPNATHLFNKPREYMAIKMGDTLGMLVSFADDPDDMKRQVASLGLRHVKYNVRPHHIPLIGPVIVNVLAEASGENWSEEIEQAWTTVINMVCENMVEAIQDGENFATNLEHASEKFQEIDDEEKMKDVLYEKLSQYCPEIFQVQDSSAPRKLQSEISISHLQTESIGSHHKSFMQEYATFKSGLTKKHDEKKQQAKEKAAKEMSKMNKGKKAYEAFEVTLT